MFPDGRWTAENLG
jgi:RimJ/RimL family protein N-acetyltransferase